MFKIDDSDNKRPNNLLGLTLIFPQISQLI